MIVLGILTGMTSLLSDTLNLNLWSVPVLWSEVLIPETGHVHLLVEERPTSQASCLPLAHSSQCHVSARVSCRTRVCDAAVL